jgi:anti-repressor protein
MRELAPFKFDSNILRVVDIGGEPWFLATDICKAIEHTQPSRVVQGLDDDEVQVIDSRGVNFVHSATFNNLGDSSLLVVSESGLYSVLVRSHKPKAKPFRKWVTSEVLPSIRKTGSYALPGFEQQRQLEYLEASVSELLPKALAFDRLDALPGSVCVSDAAKLLDMPVMSLFDWLASRKWIFRRGGKWLGFAGKLKSGMLCHCVDTVYDPDAEEEKTFVQLRVTAKGLARLSVLLPKKTTMQEAAQ